MAAGCPSTNPVVTAWLGRPPGFVLAVQQVQFSLSRILLPGEGGQLPLSTPLPNH